MGFVTRGTFPANTGAEPKDPRGSTRGSIFLLVLQTGASLCFGLRGPCTLWPDKASAFPTALLSALCPVPSSQACCDLQLHASRPLCATLYPSPHSTYRPSVTTCGACCSFRLRVGLTARGRQLWLSDPGPAFGHLLSDMPLGAVSLPGRGTSLFTSQWLPQG